MAGGPYGSKSPSSQGSGNSKSSNGDGVKDPQFLRMLRWFLYFCFSHVSHDLESIIDLTRAFTENLDLTLSDLFVGLLLLSNVQPAGDGRIQKFDPNRETKVNRTITNKTTEASTKGTQSTTPHKSTRPPNQMRNKDAENDNFDSKHSETMKSWSDFQVARFVTDYLWYSIWPYGWPLHLQKISRTRRGTNLLDFGVCCNLMNIACCYPNFFKGKGNHQAVHKEGAGRETSQAEVKNGHDAPEELRTLVEGDDGLLFSLQKQTLSHLVQQREKMYAEENLRTGFFDTRTPRRGQHGESPERPMHATQNGTSREHAKEHAKAEPTSPNKIEILYATFENEKSPPWLVLLDHHLKAMVICVRGTLSLTDCITDGMVGSVELGVAPTLKRRRSKNRRVPTVHSCDYFLYFRGS